MILAVRRHLYATNIFVFFIIYIIQKFIQVFCIIERKACKNSNCSPKNPCDERCVAPNAASPLDGAAVPPLSPIPPVRGLRLIPTSRTMRNFGYGEGHFQMFVEEKQRKPLRLNAAVAEVKLNPN